MKFGFSLGLVHPRHHMDLALEAEALGYESVWLSDHLILPTQPTASAPTKRSAARASVDHPFLPPQTPLADALLVLAAVAARTSRVSLGTFVYLPALRHPFTVARGLSTLHILSGGHALFGVGAGWLESEFVATGISPMGRGERLDETIKLCRRLWTEKEVSHEGKHFFFEPVQFEPKPPNGGPPIHVGGASKAAMRRAAHLGDGWMPNNETPDTIDAQIERVLEMRAEAGLADRPFEVSVPVANLEDLEAWMETRVDRVILGSKRDLAEARDILLGAASAMRSQ